MQLYIAGPMTGIPQFNFPAFFGAAALLRADGHTVISPPELDSPAVQAAAWASPDGRLAADGTIGGETWGQILARDVRVVADECDGLVLLNGWERSRGARLEVFVGLLTGKKFALFATRRLWFCERDDIRQVMAGQIP